MPFVNKCGACGNRETSGFHICIPLGTPENITPLDKRPKPALAEKKPYVRLNAYIPDDTARSNMSEAQKRRHALRQRNSRRRNEERDAKIEAMYLTGEYTIREVGLAFGLTYGRAQVILKRAEAEGRLKMRKSGLTSASRNFGKDLSV